MTPNRLSVAKWSFPNCTLDEVAGIARAIGLDGLDLGYRHAAAIERYRVLTEPAAYAEELKNRLGLQVAKVWHLFGENSTVRR